MSMFHFFLPFIPSYYICSLLHTSTFFSFSLSFSIYQIPSPYRVHHHIFKSTTYMFYSKSQGIFLSLIMASPFSPVKITSNFTNSFSKSLSIIVQSNVFKTQNIPSLISFKMSNFRAWNEFRSMIDFIFPRSLVQSILQIFFLRSSSSSHSPSNYFS